MKKTLTQKEDEANKVLHIDGGHEEKLHHQAHHHHHPSQHVEQGVVAAGEQVGLEARGTIINILKLIKEVVAT